MSAEEKNVGLDLGLSEEEKEELIGIARSAIERGVKGDTPSAGPPVSKKLEEPRGAFVSLHKRGMLRGCIGSLEPVAPLYKTVEEMAQSAAFRDPRFRPVTEDELPGLDVEISVLTPFREITDIDEIEVGVHGLMVAKGYRSGLLLPQVATERNWDRVTFLEQTSAKAGLPSDAWKDRDTRIYVFSADVFQ